jgi:hypothetical protein
LHSALSAKGFGARQLRVVQGRRVSLALTHVSNYASGERDENGLPDGMGRVLYKETGLVYEGEFRHGAGIVHAL